MFRYIYKDLWAFGYQQRRTGMAMFIIIGITLLYVFVVVYLHLTSEMQEMLDLEK